MTRYEKREEWAGLVELWRQSGLNKAAFCREYGVKSWMKSPPIIGQVGGWFRVW